MDPSLEERARTMPSQGGVAIASELRRFAAATPDGTAIVEVGCWLGAGTAQLALGVAGRPDPPVIHVYDRFEASASEVEKAAAFGVRLRSRQDTLPVVRDLLAPFGAPMQFYRGSIDGHGWNGGPIGLYVDDAAKQPHDFHHVLRTFGPSWVPGVTVLVLMDFNYWRKHTGKKATALRTQHDVFAANARSFEPLADADPAGTSTAFFRYVAPMDFRALPVSERPGPSFSLRRARSGFKRLFGGGAA